jgi:hypothetical protein
MVIGEGHFLEVVVGFGWQFFGFLFGDDGARGD